jgi:hypothetical protein
VYSDDVHAKTPLLCVSQQKAHVLSAGMVRLASDSRCFRFRRVAERELVWLVSCRAAVQERMTSDWTRDDSKIKTIARMRSGLMCQAKHPRGASGRSHRSSILSEEPHRRHLYHHRHLQRHS